MSKQSLCPALLVNMSEGRKYLYVKKRTSLVKAIKSFYSRLDEMEMELRDNSEHFYSLNILREGREIERGGGGERVDIERAEGE